MYVSAIYIYTLSLSVYIYIYINTLYIYIYTYIDHCIHTHTHRYIRFWYFNHIVNSLLFSIRGIPQPLDRPPHFFGQPAEPRMGSFQIKGIAPAARGSAADPSSLQGAKLPIWPLGVWTVPDLPWFLLKYYRKTMVNSEFAKWKIIITTGQNHAKSATHYTSYQCAMASMAMLLHQRLGHLELESSVPVIRWMWTVWWPLKHRQRIRQGCLESAVPREAGWKIPWMEDLIARKIIDVYGPFSSQPCLLTRGYPLVICYAIEHGAFIVDLLIKDGDFQLAKYIYIYSYVSLPEGRSHDEDMNQKCLQNPSRFRHWVQLDFIGSYKAYLWRLRGGM